MPALFTDEDIEILRTRVAEKLGWRALRYNRYGVLVGQPPGKGSFLPVPSYARDMKAVWEISDRLAESRIPFRIRHASIQGRLCNYFVEIDEQ